MTLHIEKRRSKYNAKPETVDGIRFASTREANRYRELKMLERAGEITHLTLQPVYKFSIDGRPVLIRSARYPNGRQASYRGDFRYMDVRKKRFVVEDVKGVRTDVYLLKKALVECMYFGIKVEEV